MNKKGSFLTGVIIAIFVLLCISIPIILSYTSVDNATITIKDKERVTTRDNSYYLIFTEGEVFKNEDSLLFLKFDSSDIYNNLNVGNTYRVKVNWFRIPFFSSYRNILEIYNGN